MFLVLSKVVWAVAQPVSLTVIFLVLGLLLSLVRWRRTAWFMVLLGTAIITVCAFTSFGYVLVQGLENRFVRPAAPPTEVAGIIVLGGGMDTDVNNSRRGYELNRSGDRFLETLRLAELYPAAKVVMTGGGSVLTPGDEREAVAAERLFADFDIAPERLVLEDAALNSEENAQLTRQLLNPQPGEIYLLVTSAFHMPRAVALFRRAGFNVVPWPADYLSGGNESFGFKITQPAENISVSTIALREWVGLLAYWVTGRIDELLPGP
jgi:uncharacterized SAM-binding protein YcdF (DUF218 family)